MFCTFSSSTVIPSSFPFRIRLGTLIKALTYTNLQWKWDHHPDSQGLSSKICNRQAQAAQKFDRHGIHCTAGTGDTLLCYSVKLSRTNYFWREAIAVLHTSGFSTYFHESLHLLSICFTGNFHLLPLKLSCFHGSFHQFHGSKFSSMEVKFNYFHGRSTSVETSTYFHGSFDQFPWKKKLPPLRWEQIYFHGN